jgi:broad specificity phosphatase PhoE
MWLNIIRHGQSMANVGRGRTPDDGLTDLGKQQASLLAEYFMNIPVTHMFSSPFTRVIQTAAPTALAKGIQLVLIPELSEIFDAVHRRDHPYAGCEEMEQTHPYANFTRHHDRNTKWWPDYPETQGVEVRQRVEVFFQRELVPLLGLDTHVLVFGHGATTGELRRLVHPDDTGEQPGNAVIFQCKLDGDGRCIGVPITHFK